MIRAMIFDLDGTLVQTEKLKALSYAKAVVELCPQEIQEVEAIEAFKEVVGLSRKEVAEWLIERFNLSGSLQTCMNDLGVNTAWQAFIQVRMQYYEEITADPNILRNNQWPHNMALLQAARNANCRLGLASMSDCSQVQRVLKILDLESTFDFVASRDDVEHGKPDPEIYTLVAAELAVPAEECLVIEDSPSGVKASQAAGMWVIAVTTPFTRQAFRETQLLDASWVVDDPSILPQTVRQFFKDHN
jgi:HAD superfamily hydrolase (TIGR01509 family)